MYSHSTKNRRVGSNCLELCPAVVHEKLNINSLSDGVSGGLAVIMCGVFCLLSVLNGGLG